jgi:hypothetical protein
MSLTTGVVVERVGDELMVIIPGNNGVVSLSGRPAEVLLDVQAGKKVDAADPALRDLVDCGIVSAPGLSRRSLIKAGVIGAGAGIAVIAMPGVAAASSSPRTRLAGFFDFDDESNPSSVQFIIGDGYDYVLDDPRFVEYLAANNLPAYLPDIPSPLPSTSLSDIGPVNCPELGLSAVPLTGFYPSDPGDGPLVEGDTYLQWDLENINTNVTVPDIVVGFFTWADEQFEVYFGRNF